MLGKTTQFQTGFRHAFHPAFLSEGDAMDPAFDGKTQADPIFELFNTRENILADGTQSESRARARVCVCMCVCVCVCWGVIYVLSV